MRKKISILGATGSIGVSTLDVISNHLDQFEVFALTGQKQVEVLIQQCIKFKPRYVVVCDQQNVKRFRELTQHLHLPSKLLTDEEGLCQVASDPEVDIVMAAIVGAAGLSSTLAALKAGKKVLLANKEALVMAGDLVLEALRHSGGALIPVDSEHSAIFQCLPQEFMAGRLFPRNKESVEIYHGISKIVLTASGGATRDLPLEKLAEVSPEFACTHPNWSMGKKITVDSATMMNKALEVIEAYYLFGLPLENIEVVLHPQSIIHSMVCYEDASVLVQLGQPDMRTPIACALAWPERVSTKVPPLDLTQTSALSFFKFNMTRYPCLSLGYEALRQGGVAPTILNAANEVAVARFLNHEIRFTDIYRLNERMLAEVPQVKAEDIDLEMLKAIDLETREKTKS